jgi:hypothetical protein
MQAAKPPATPNPSRGEGPRAEPEVISPAPNAMKPGFQGVRTRWIRGFMAFRKLMLTRIVMLMVPE